MIASFDICFYILCSVSLTAIRYSERPWSCNSDGSEILKKLIGLSVGQRLSVKKKVSYKI